MALRLYLDFVVFVFGAIIGSFLNVCIHRMPRGESIVNPPSHCPHCNTRIRWRDNVPLISWPALRGKCRYCGAKITSRYFLVELLTAVLFLAVWLAYERTWVAPVYWVLVAGLIIATFIDFEHYIIPNEITMGGAAAGFFLSLCVPALHGGTNWLAAARESAVGIAVGAVVMFFIIEMGKLAFGRLKIPLPAGTAVRIEPGKIKVGEDETPFEEVFSRDSDRILFRAATLTFGEQTLTDAQVSLSETKLRVGDQEHELAQVGPVNATTDLLVLPREAMGMGDMKLMAGLGAFLGWKATLFCLMLSSVLGTVIALALVVLRKRELHGRIPYGPYIAAASLVWIFGGREWVQWYLQNMFGG